MGSLGLREAHSPSRSNSRRGVGEFPKTDLQKFATMAGFKTPASAGISLNLPKKKIMGDAGSAKSTPKKSTPSKRRQADSEASNGEGDESDEIPTKKLKPTPKKAGKKKAESQQEPGDDEGTLFIHHDVRPER